MSVDWSAFVEIIQAHQKFVLTSHIRPDCDALGSELGMAGVLESLGKDVVIVNGHFPCHRLEDYRSPPDGPCSLPRHSHKHSLIWRDCHGRRIKLAK